MKNFKFLNIETGRSTVVTSEAKLRYEKDDKLKKTMKLLYPCDESGNRIDGKEDLPLKEESIEDIMGINAGVEINDEEKKEEVYVDAENQKETEINDEEKKEEGVDAGSGKPEKSKSRGNSKGK